MSPFLTSSSSVWPTAFWNAASTLAWVLPRSDAKCDTKSLHTADALPDCWPVLAVGAPGLGADVDAAGRKPTLRPAAEAVIQTARRRWPRLRLQVPEREDGGRSQCS